MLLFGFMSQYDRNFDLKINIGHHDLYFMVQWFCLISWRLFDVCTSYFGRMNQYDQTFDLKINVGHCDLYYVVQWFLPYILKTFWCMNIIMDMSQYDPKFYLKIDIGNCDLYLYFMVQWFCVTSWRLFDVWTSYFRIKGQYDLTFYLKINMSLWPQSKYKSTWPIFHGLVILLSIFKIIWWINIIVGIMDQCDTYIDLTKYM